MNNKAPDMEMFKIINHSLNGSSDSVISDLQFL